MAEHVWRAFRDLNRTRGSTGFGPSAISWQDIHFWQQVTRLELEPWERDLVLAIDGEFIAHLSDERRKAEARRQK